MDGIYGKEKNTKKSPRSLVPAERIERSILLIRDHKVLLDTDLAELYGVQAKVLNQAAKRNLDRFPADFMFKLNDEEFTDLKSHFVTSTYEGDGGRLRSQSVTLKPGRGRHRKYAPYVFTEQGVAMLSSVLRSKQAVAAD